MRQEATIIKILEEEVKTGKYEGSKILVAEVLLLYMLTADGICQIMAVGVTQQRIM